MSYSQVTLAQLQTQLAEKYDGAQFWTAEEARLGINEGLRVYNMLTGVFRQSLSLIIPANDYFLSLPGTMTYRTRVMVGGVPLEPATLHDMNNGRPNWRSETVASGGTVPSAVKSWVPAGMTLLFVWPTPIANQAVTVEGVATAPILVNAGDQIDIGQEDIGPLLGYVLHYLLFKEGGIRFKGSMKYYRDFIDACAEKNSRIRLSNLWRYAQGLDLNRSQAVLQQRPVAKPGPPAQ